MSDPYAPYFDTSGCLVTPARPAIAYQPARIEQRAVTGWNAGANSIDQLDGDLHVVFAMPMGVAGVVLGLKGSRRKQTVPELIEHGFYFQSLGGTNLVQIIERGVAKSTNAARAANDTFEIRRVGGAVTYLKNNVRIYSSSQPSRGPLVVNTCLYASGDAVGGST